MEMGLQVVCDPMHAPTEDMTPENNQTMKETAPAPATQGASDACVVQTSWLPEEYEQAIQNTFDFTQESYNEALYTAARLGLPVVAVFGSIATVDTRKMITELIPKAQQSGSNNAIYLYIDLDKIDPQSPVGVYVNNSSLRSEQVVFTSTFAMHPGPNGEPTPDSALMTAWGGRDDIAQLLPEYIGYGCEHMRQHLGNFRVPLECPAEAEDETLKWRAQVFENASSDLTTIRKELEQAAKSKTLVMAEQHYHQAMAKADGAASSAFNNQKILLDLIREEEAKPVQDESLLSSLAQEEQLLRDLQNARSFTRANLGLACMGYGFYEVGARWLVEAAKRDTSMLDDQRFLSVLARKCPGDKLEVLLQIIRREASTRDTTQSTTHDTATLSIAELFTGVQKKPPGRDLYRFDGSTDPQQDSTNVSGASGTTAPLEAPSPAESTA